MTLKQYEVMIHSDGVLMTLPVEAERVIQGHNFFIFLDAAGKMIAAFDGSSIVGWQRIDAEEAVN